MYRATRRGSTSPGECLAVSRIVVAGLVCSRVASAASGTLECASVVNVPTSVELGTSYFHASPAPMFSEDVSNTPLTYSARSLGNAACGETSAVSRRMVDGADSIDRPTPCSLVFDTVRQG